MTPYEQLLQEGFVHNLMLANNRRRLQADIRAKIHEAEQRVESQLRSAVDGLTEADVNRIRRGVYRGSRRLENLAARMDSVSDAVADTLQEELVKAARELAAYEAMFWQDRYNRLAQEDDGFAGVVDGNSALTRNATTQVSQSPLVFGTIAASILAYRQNRKRRLRRNATSAAQSEGLNGIRGLLTVTRGARRVGRIIGETTRSLNGFIGDVHTHASAVGAQVFADSQPAFDLVWTAIIDERTSTVCVSRNGKLVNRDLGGLLPPAHINCRSIAVPLVLQENLNRTQRRRLRPDTRRAVERGLPDFNSTDESFNALNPAQQLQILGPTRFRIFREGDFSVRDFIGSDEKFITLDQLAAREGLDISEFRG